jgi:hypothetical protein
VRGRRTRNSLPDHSLVSPATKYRRFSRLFAYAQAADQHVWVGGLSFMGRVCGVLLNLCIGQKGGAPGHGRGDKLRFRALRWAAFECCTGHALCSTMQLPYSTTSGSPHLEGADRAAHRRSASVTGRRCWSLLPPSAVVELRATTAWPDRHRGADPRSRPYPPRVPRIGERETSPGLALRETAAPRKWGFWTVAIEGSARKQRFSGPSDKCIAARPRGPVRSRP